MTKPGYILALDQGTTSSRALLFDTRGEIKGCQQKEISQSYPNPAWVEQDALEIWETTRQAVKNLLEQTKVSAQQIAAIGITNQRESVVVWDRISGNPVYPVIVWQSRQSDEICRRLQSMGYADEIRNKTGLLIDPYFSASKLSWLFEQFPDLKSRADKGELLFGTVDTWLIWKLSNGRSHITDVTNASRTLLYNIHTLEWDKDLLDIFSVPACILPQVTASSGSLATTAAEVFGSAIPICGIAGDQQAALFGQRCTSMGKLKNTYGTGCFALMHTGNRVMRSDSGLLTTIAWKIGDQVEYALEGSVFVAGAAINWLRDSLQLIKSAKESGSLAESAGSNDGVYVVPAFVGLGAPYWNSAARAAVFGMSFGTRPAHLVRAVLESLAFQSKDLIKQMQADSGIEPLILRVDGGVSRNDFLMQFQADILNVCVERPQQTETTAAGAAYLAGLASGFWDANQLDSFSSEGATRFEPGISPSERQKLYQGWLRAVEATIKFSS